MCACILHSINKIIASCKFDSETLRYTPIINGRYEDNIRIIQYCKLFRTIMCTHHKILLFVGSILQCCFKYR